MWVVLLIATTPARAGDGAASLAGVVEEASRSAAAEAASVDALAAARDYAGWKAARNRYLDRLDELRRTVEDASAAVMLGASPDPTEARVVADAAKLVTRLADARFAYRVLTAGLVQSPPSGRDGLAARRSTLGQAAVTLAGGWEAVRRQARIKKSADNLRSIVLMYIASGAGMEKPWPKFSGKRLALWPVATNLLDRNDPRNLEILFSPEDTARSVEKAGGPAGFGAITMASLRDAGVDVARFTSYVGRNSAEHPLTAAELSESAPVLADLSFGDVAIVAFTSASVKTMTKAELGLDPDDPLTVGPTSKSPILRVFSSE